MTRKTLTGREIVSLIQQGTLTRRQFEAWHMQRRRPGGGIVLAMRDSPPRRPRHRHRRKARF